MENKSEMVYPLKDIADEAMKARLTSKKWYRAFQVLRTAGLIIAGLFGVIILIATVSNGNVAEGIFATSVFAVIVYFVDLGITYAVRYIAVGK